MSSDFQKDWGFPSEVRATIPDAAYYDVRPVPGTYKSGRPKFECLFLSNDRKKVIARREAMELIARKTGKPYHVCRRAESWGAGQPLPAAAQFSIDDVLAA